MVVDCAVHSMPLKQFMILSIGEISRDSIVWMPSTTCRHCRMMTVSAGPTCTYHNVPNCHYEGFVRRCRDYRASIRPTLWPTRSPASLTRSTLMTSLEVRIKNFLKYKDNIICSFLVFLNIIVTILQCYLLFHLRKYNNRNYFSFSSHFLSIMYYLPGVFYLYPFKTHRCHV